MGAAVLGAPQAGLQRQRRQLTSGHDFLEGEAPAGEAPAGPVLVGTGAPSLVWARQAPVALSSVPGWH